MQSNPVPQKTFILEYPLASVKHAINNTTRLASFMLRSKNDILNTYKIAIVIGLNSGIMDVSLTPVDENKTSCVFQIYNTVGGYSASAQLSALQDKFLETFSQILAGKIKIINNPKVKKEIISGKAAFIIIFIILLAFVIFIAKHQ